MDLLRPQQGFVTQCVGSAAGTLQGLWNATLCSMACSRTALCHHCMQSAASTHCLGNKRQTQRQTRKSLPPPALAWASVTTTRYSSTWTFCCILCIALQDPMDTTPAVLVKRYNITEQKHLELQLTAHQDALQRLASLVACKHS